MSRRILSFHYTLSNLSGDILDSSSMRGPLALLEGGGQIIPGLEKEIVRLKTGDKKEIKVPAAEAYGEKEEDLLIKVPRSKLPAQEIKVGDRFRGGDDPQSPVFVVTALDENEATLDGNHPLAGQDLVFQIEVTEIREATAEELTHGHVHGAGGHSH